MTDDVSRLRVRDLFGEAVNGILQRPTRSALTMLGTVLGIGSFVAILGLTQTASSQISQRFSALDATTVIVEDLTPERTAAAALAFPTDADERIAELNGVDAAGVTWKVPLGADTVSAQPDGAPTQLEVVATSAGLTDAIGPSLGAGTTINEFHSRERQRVAVLGAAAARQLGITRIDDQPAVFIGSEPYTVIGILDDTDRLPDLMLSVLIPDTVALDRYGPPEPAAPASMVIATAAGAAGVVAGQAAAALRPDDPAALHPIAPPDPTHLRDSVATDVNTLLLTLAAIAVVVGALGIANTTLVAILERSAEIGLRRSLGARPRHITSQFLTESCLLGGIGGLLGATLGVLAVVATALAQNWTAIVNPAHVLPAPLAGAAVGLAAGLYPALRAARIEPARAMRQ
jgi:putative ABC transport system permease protein